MDTAGDMTRRNSKAGESTERNEEETVVGKGVFCPQKENTGALNYIQYPSTDVVLIVVVPRRGRDLTSSSIAIWW